MKILASNFDKSVDDERMEAGNGAILGIFKFTYQLRVGQAINKFINILQQENLWIETINR